MKRVKQSKAKNATKFVRINLYTWIEKKVEEPDEVIRQKFLMKLSQVINSPEHRLKLARTCEI